MSKILMLLLIVVVILLICVIVMSIGIWIKKDGKFPEYEVGHNKNMRKLGIKCVYQEETEMLARSKRKNKIKDKKHNCDICDSDCDFGNDIKQS